MTAEFERLAYEAALRSLDKQETYVEELRARTGVLLAASSIAASFLGQAVQSSGSRSLVVAGLLAFVVSIGTGVFILLPKQGLVFAPTGPGLYESGFPLRKDMPEVYRRLTYQLHEFWEANDEKTELLIRTFVTAAFAVAVEILALAVLLGSNILSS